MAENEGVLVSGWSQNLASLYSRNNQKHIMGGKGGGRLCVDDSQR